MEILSPANAFAGPTGVGKTFVACAFGQQACRHGHRVIYRRMPRLFPELTLAHGDGTYPTLLAWFARVEVLILDDWGLASLKETRRQDLLKILDDRDSTRFTIITSQLPIDRWHEHLGDPTRSSTGWCTAPIGSRSADRRAEKQMGTDPPHRRRVKATYERGHPDAGGYSGPTPVTIVVRRAS